MKHPKLMRLLVLAFFSFCINAAKKPRPGIPLIHQTVFSPKGEAYKVVGPERFLDVMASMATERMPEMKQLALASLHHFMAVNPKLTIGGLIPTYRDMVDYPILDKLLRTVCPSCTEDCLKNPESKKALIKEVMSDLTPELITGHVILKDFAEYLKGKEGMVVDYDYLAVAKGLVESFRRKDLDLSQEFAIDSKEKAHALLLSSMGLFKAMSEQVRLGQLVKLPSLTQIFKYMPILEEFKGLVSSGYERWVSILTKLQSSGLDLYRVKLDHDAGKDPNQDDLKAMLPLVILAKFGFIKHLVIEGNGKDPQASSTWAFELKTAIQGLNISVSIAQHSASCEGSDGQIIVSSVPSWEERTFPTSLETLASEETIKYDLYVITAASTGLQDLCTQKAVIIDTLALQGDSERALNKSGAPLSFNYRCDGQASQWLFSLMKKKSNSAI